MTGGELELDGTLPTRDPLPAIGDWAADVPPAPHSQAARTREIDDKVLELKSAPGMWQLVECKPGRSPGGGSSYRARGCEVRTRHRIELGATELWVRWPVLRELPGNPGGRGGG